MGKLTSWLKQETPVTIVPVLIGSLLLSSKILYMVFYLSLRISLRIALGKGRRDKLFTKKGLEFRQDYFPAKFHQFIFWLNFMTMLLDFLEFMKPFY